MQPPMPFAGRPQDAARRSVAAWADWYVRMGALDSLNEGGVDRYRAAPHDAPAPAIGRAASSAPPSPSLPVVPASPARRPGERDRAGHARSIASACASLGELEAALERFDGCALKETATRLCFADGSPQAPLMLIGEAPGAEEDRQGKPFVGPSGQLLDRMLAAIGLDRSAVWITNLLFWRPPGNRPPTTTEVAICQPFLERQIELLAPGLILFLGGSAAKALLDVSEGVTRLRGRRFAYQPAGALAPIPAYVTFHPAYLLRQPLHKRLVWRDLLTLREELDELQQRAR
jgi:uracil-DNA glycosylase family 4